MADILRCSICKRPARRRLLGFALCLKCYTATTSPVDVCFECLKPLAPGEEIYCTAHDLDDG